LAFTGLYTAWTGISFEDKRDAGLLDGLHRSALAKLADAALCRDWVYRDFTSLMWADAEDHYRELTVGGQESYRKILEDLKSWMEVLTASRSRWR
jgi:hypothetical protein